MKGNAKCRNCVSVGWLGSLKVIGNVAIRQSTYNFLIEKLCIYLLPFSSYSELFVKSHQVLPTPTAFGAFIGGDHMSFTDILEYDYLGYRDIVCVICM